MCYNDALHKFTFYLLTYFREDEKMFQLHALVAGQVMKTARLTDFGVVPVFGCTVKVSVAEVVTSAWVVCTFCGFVSTNCNFM